MESVSKQWIYGLGCPEVHVPWSMSHAMNHAPCWDLALVCKDDKQKRERT